MYPMFVSQTNSFVKKVRLIFNEVRMKPPMQCHREKKRGHKGELAQRFSETQVLKIEILQ